MDIIPDSFFVTTTDQIVGYKIVKHIGLVMERNIPQGKMFEKRNYEIIFSEMTTKILEKAKKQGGNAVIKATFIPTSSQSGSISDILAYGTAVKIEPVS